MVTAAAGQNTDFCSPREEQGLSLVLAELRLLCLNPSVLAAQRGNCLHDVEKPGES